MEKVYFAKWIKLIKIEFYRGRVTLSKVIIGMMSHLQASKNYGWASSGCSILSEIGTMHLEFTYLSDITNNPVFKSKVENVRKVLKNLEKPKGLYPNYIHPKTGKWGQRELFFLYYIKLKIHTYLYENIYHNMEWIVFDNRVRKESLTLSDTFLRTASEILIQKLSKIRLNLKHRKFIYF